jgi:hypothetical protein
MTNLRTGKDWPPKIFRKKFQNHENAIPEKWWGRRLHAAAREAVKRLPAFGF